jgi:ribosomal subunit interface protein
MMHPVQVTIRDFPYSKALETHIREKAEKLNQYSQKINTCRVIITVPQKHKHNGKLYCVCIDLTVPGKEIVVNRKKNEDIYIAIRDAFHAVIRKLEDYERKRHGFVKKHDMQIRGYISKLFDGEGFGFIQGIDGNEYYFSHANVTYPTYPQLEIGDIVSFVGVPGGDSLQAHRVVKEKGNEWLGKI